MDCYINTRRQYRNSNIHTAPASPGFFDPPTMLMILEGVEGKTEDSAGLKEMQMEVWQVLKIGRIRVSVLNTFLTACLFL
jgi:hypothetical protein